MSGKVRKAFPFSIPVIAVFMAANGLISMPFSGGNLWSFIAALLLAAVILPLSFKVSTRVSIKGGVVSRSAAAIGSLVLLFPAAEALEYCEFVYKAVLPHADMWLIAALFVLCVVCLALSPGLALLKFAFLSFSGLFAAVILLFIMSAKTFELSNLKAAFESGFSLAGTPQYACKLVLPTVAALLFLRVYTNNSTAPQVLCGAAAGGGIAAAVVLDSVLSFGLPLAEKLNYPYIDDISTVTVGSLFTRMDALAYFAFFAAYVFKCALCVKTSARLLRYAMGKVVCMRHTGD